MGYFGDNGAAEGVAEEDDVRELAPGQLFGDGANDEGEVGG